MGDYPDAYFSVHVLIPVHYTKPNAMDSRHVYQFTCKLQSRSCSGAWLRLDEVDKGEPLSALALNRMDDASLVAMTGTVATVEWDGMNVFTIDLARGVVTYVYSTPTVSGSTEARGEATCEIADNRKCTTNSDCLPALHCSDGLCVNPNARR